MADAQEARPEYKDRSLGLVIFGSVAILIGVFCALLVPLSLAGTALSGAGGGSALRTSVATTAIYMATAVAFVLLGIGSIRARRWARELLLSLSWIWLLTGVCSAVVGLVVLPPLMRQLAAEYGLTADWVAVVNVVVFSIVAVFYVLLPAAFVLFYRSPHVEATCRVRDRGSAWIDRCPRRLLTLTVVWVLLAVSVLLMPAYNFVFPVFGWVLTGIPGAGLWTLVFALCWVLAVGTLRCAPWAWWGGVAFTVLAGLSSTVALLHLDLTQIIPLLDLPEDEVVVATTMLTTAGRGFLVPLNLLVWGTFAGYLWSLRRLFATAPSDGDV